MDPTQPIDVKCEYKYSNISILALVHVGSGSCCQSRRTLRCFYPQDLGQHVLSPQQNLSNECFIVLDLGYAYVYLGYTYVFVSFVFRYESPCLVRNGLSARLQPLWAIVLSLSQCWCINVNMSILLPSVSLVN